MKRIIIIFRNKHTGDEEYFLVTTTDEVQKIKTMLLLTEWSSPDNAVKELEKMGLIFSYLKLDDDSIIQRGNPNGGLIIEWS